MKSSDQQNAQSASLRFRTRAGFTLGRFIVTTGMQAGCAPLADRCRTEAEDGRVFWGWAILLTPWRRNRYGESLPQRALVVGVCR